MSEELFSELYADVLSDCPSDFEFSDSDSDDSDIRPSKRQRRILSDSEADSDEEWNDIDIVPSLEDYSRNSRVPNFECDPPSIVDVIDSFFDDEFFNLVVSQTNLYHTQMKDLHKNSAKTLQWKEVTTNDMKKFLGLLVKVHDELIPVNLDTIFRRIFLSLLKKSDGELQTYFQFELTPFPLSLFDEGGLRKTPKSVFYDLFSTTTVVHFTSAYVVDDGFLLHRVLWQAKESFSFILKQYVDYAKKYFNERASTIFYGYPEDADKSTKSVERMRRTKKHISDYVMFDESMSASLSQ
ncbi:hypothetical protein AVEN_35322-1 [Araneus ventricosus]|uniref:PiggyBac transposable element-derived protein domain-containing protein n=1 Tax=Araneus ventricosus TaxID=182803 RepID=A0A4Y2REV3_ARAVE|nr:hypothetical protein AVEN_35322-1 [Araneus ventricosus]